jgi:hypothetical protein
MEKLQKWGRDASSIFEGDQLFFDIPKQDIKSICSESYKVIFLSNIIWK